MKQLLKNSIITFIIAVVCLSCCFLNAAVKKGITIDNVTTNLKEIQTCSINVQSNCTNRIQCINDKIDACNKNLNDAIVSCNNILSNINNNSKIETNLEDFCKSTNKINIVEIKTDIEKSKKEIQTQINSFNNLTNTWETNRKCLETEKPLEEFRHIYASGEQNNTRRLGYDFIFKQWVTNFTTSTNQFYAKTKVWEKEIDKINDSFNIINTLISNILEVANQKIVDPGNNIDKLEELDKLKDYLCEHGKIKFVCENTRKINIDIANKIIEKVVPCGEEIPFEQIKLEYLNPDFKITGWETNGNLVVAKIKVKVTISGQDAWYEYGTKVSDIEDKNANGKTFEYWSEKENGEKYTKEEITTPITLYPVYKKCEEDSSDIVNGKCINPNCPSNLLPPPAPKCNICGSNLGTNGKCSECKYCPIHKDTVLVSGKCPDCQYCPIHENTVLVSGKCSDCKYCPTHENTVLVFGKCSECQYCPTHENTVLVFGKCPDCQYCPTHKDTVLVSGKCSDCKYCSTHENTVLVSGKCPKCVISPPPLKGWLYEVTLFIEKYISLTQAIVADVILFIIMILTISVAVVRCR